MSGPDDREAKIVDYRSGSDDEEIAVDYEDFTESAISAMRLAMARVHARYVGGRMETSRFDPTAAMTNEKMFRVSKLFEWSQGVEPVDVIEALKAGRVRARLSAAMGAGKSTLLATKLANACSLRVLHVSLEAHALQQVSVYMQDNAIGKFSRRWTTRRGARVCCMTYADYCGHMQAATRADLFKSFDLVLFDEAAVVSAEVFVACSTFSTYALPETSVLLCSANVRNDEAGETVVSSRMGNVNVSEVTVQVSDAVKSRSLMSRYLVDRTVAVVPGNAEVGQLAGFYEENGIDVVMLDDASGYDAFSSACEWLKGDATTPRVLVAHVKWAIQYNLMLEYVVLFPYAYSGEIEGSRWVERLQPLSEKMVCQAVARVGRGIGDSSGALVMSSERDNSGLMTKAERNRAFVLLCAAAIRPMRSDMWADSYELFPDGLTPAAAQNLLKVCMPVEIAARYLGSDGKFAASYASALSLFAQPDHFLLPSCDKLPVGYDEWATEDVSHRVGGSMSVKLPISAEGEIQTVILAVELVARKLIAFERWRPARGFSYGDGYNSEEEELCPRYAKGVAVPLRRVDDREFLPERQVVRQVDSVPWAYRQQVVGGSIRRGGYMDSDRCREALRKLEASLWNYEVPKLEVETVQETDQGTVVAVEIEGVGDVESPGGSVVCTLPVKVCEKLNTGALLTSSELVGLVAAARVEKEKFVASKLFDSFAGPWDCYLGSLMDHRNASEILSRGLYVDAYAMVDLMRARFSTEVCSVLAQSNVLKKKFLGIFSRVPSMDALMKAIYEGKFDGVAQTRAFLNRVRTLKRKIDDVLVSAEKTGVYLPTYITNAQRALPLHSDTSVGRVGGAMEAMPERVARRLLIRGDNDRGGGL